MQSEQHVYMTHVKSNKHTRRRGEISGMQAMQAEQTLLRVHDDATPEGIRASARY